ncbi:hypothetical protein FZC33_33095 [Labrys sp. KNU-23]|uniref:hypothetical protein n=1 Tax=Labrys sp. KNU-23 TaxID=2789216 RepID=UPI0011EDC789|nr:hypothetical protein [Labrys sp. KNU-23]QEN90837.1 hypothetical protein FZC33_33095 [Labrys sp. KNU-23]
MRLTIIPIILSLYNTTAYAADPVTVNSLLENVCIASDLSSTNIKHMIDLYTNTNNLKITDVPTETLPALTETIKAAWEIRGENEKPFIITYIENTAGKNIYHGCVIISASDDYISIKNFIHKKYKILSSFERTQRDPKILFYRIAIYGKYNKGIGIQIFKRPISTTKKMSVSYFEIPGSIIE